MVRCLFLWMVLGPLLTSDFGFLGAKDVGAVVFCSHRGKCFAQFTFTMLNTVLFVKPMAAAIALQLSPAW